MKLTVLAVGRPKESFALAGIQEYVKRLRVMLPLELAYLPDVRGIGVTGERRAELEGAEILRRLTGRDRLVLMDERGHEPTSEELSAEFYRRLDETPGRLVVLIGGPWGVSPAVRERADALWALSRLTFPHELALLMLIEQLYRAVAIRSGSGYHHR